MHRRGRSLQVGYHSSGGDYWGHVYISLSDHVLHMIGKPTQLTAGFAHRNY